MEIKQNFMLLITDTVLQLWVWAAEHQSWIHTSYWTLAALRQREFNSENADLAVPSVQMKWLDC